MPFYVGGHVGPLGYSHRIGGRRRRPAPRRARPARPESPAVTRARLIAGMVILAACAMIVVALIVSAL
jgi:hypothetical protein